MPTFFEVYQEYLKDPRSTALGKKQQKRLHHTISYHYDRWHFKTPLEYKTVEENGETFNVRIYPDGFVQRMKMVIISYAVRYKNNLAIELANQQKNKEGKTEAKVVVLPEKKKRKRIPLKEKSP